MPDNNWRNRVNDRLEGKASSTQSNRRKKKSATAAAIRAASKQASQTVVRPTMVSPKQAETAYANSSGANASIVPPGTTPPSPAKRLLEGDQPKSLRGYVLAGCFIWGLLLGFLYHVSEDQLIQPKEHQSNRPKVADEEKIYKPVKAELQTSKAKELTKGFTTEKLLQQGAKSADRLNKKMLQSSQKTTVYLPTLAKDSFGEISGRTATAYSAAGRSSSSPSISRSKLEPEPGSGAEPDLDF